MSVNVGMQCVPCYREGLIAKKGDSIKFEPPFAFAVIHGESVCPKHLESAKP